MKNLILLFCLFSATLLTTCKKSCENIVCENNGECINGLCNCPEMWTGENCTIPVTPKTIKITQVNFEKIPEFDQDGELYDSLDGPDIYFEFYDESNLLIQSDCEYNVNNITVDNPLKFILSEQESFEINPSTFSHKVIVYDKDENDDDDIILNANYHLLNPQSEFPETRRFGVPPNNYIIFKVFFSYEY